MSKTFRGWKIDEPLLLPLTVGDFVAEDRPLCAESDPRTISTSPRLPVAVAGKRGQPPFDPTMMTALLLYSYSCGIYSSHRIAKACPRACRFHEHCRARCNGFPGRLGFPQAALEGAWQMTNAIEINLGRKPEPLRKLF
jgi:hypothetical protein